MTFLLDSDNRNGRVKADSGSDDRTQRYNTPDEHGLVRRTLTASRPSGDGVIETSVETFSEYLGKTSFSCTGVTFRSKGSIRVPERPAAGGLASIEDRIAMGIRIPEAGRVRLVASVVSDLDIVVLELQGPEFVDRKIGSPTHGQSAPFRFDDQVDRVLTINTPGEYVLLGTYRLDRRLPHPDLMLELVIEMSATLTPEN